MNEAKDSLRSKATLSILDLLGEGPIGALVGNLKGVYLNGTPVENANGTKNFQGLSWDIRGGGNTQPVMPGYGNYIESPYSVGVQIKTTTPYTFSVSRSDADAVRVIVSVPALSATNGENGDISGTTVSYKISTSSDNGVTWTAANISSALAGASWSIENGYHTATRPANSTVLRATIQATGTADGSYLPGTITVQPQWKPTLLSPWLNLGAAKTLNVSWVVATVGWGDSQSSYWTVNGESYSVESEASKIRFVVVSQSAPWLSIGPGAANSLTPSPTAIIEGKTRSRYQRSHIIPITPGTQNRIRMERLTADSTSALLQNDTFLDSYSEIVSLNMEYPNSAIIGLRVDSEQFGGSIPSRAYLIDGLYIRVPVNYDPVARTYAGVWNGTFKYAVSNNPAWIMFDVLTHKRYGLGNFIEDAQVDKSMLYTIGKYCDELVPNGFGGTEPRFTLNTVIANAFEAYKLISDIASVFRGMGFWDGGMVSFTQDSPADPVMIYSSANVIDGDFSYSGSARKDRHSVVHVTWNDPDDNYKQRVEYVEDAELVNLYGVRKMDTLAFGCTSRGQATRVGKWILYTEKYESDLISFRVGIDSAFVMPGNIIKIHDPNRAGRRAAGRLKASTSTSATLDAETEISGITTISIMMPDGTFQDRQILQSAGLYSTVTWVTPLTQVPVANAVWMTTDASLEPILARVVGVAQGQNPSEFDIAALEHNPSKFNAIEQGWALQERKTSIIDASFVQTPTQLFVTEARYKAAPGVFSNKMMIYWYGNSSQYEVAYRGVSTSNASNWTTVRVTDGLSYELPGVEVGVYEVSVIGINPLGQRSESATGTYTLVGKTAPPSSVTTAFAIPNELGVEVSWLSVPDEDIKFYEVRACSVPGQAWESATMVAQPTGNVYQAPPAAAGVYEWLIKAVDTSLNSSVTAFRVSATIAPPGTVTPSYSYSRADIVLTWGAATAGSLPVSGYIIKRGATWAAAVLVGTTTDLSYKTPVKWASTQTIWVAATDAAGSVGTPTSVNAVFALPAATVVTSAKKGTNFTLDWSTPSSSLPLASYEVRFGSTFANGVTIGSISGNQLTIPINWLGSRTFWVAAIDLNGNVGAATSHPLTVIAPRAATGFAALYNQGQVTMSWTDVTETLPVDFYEIRRGADWNTGVVVGKAYTNTLTLEVSWSETATFQVRATDVNGNVGAIGTYVNGITGPGTVSVAHQFKDGNAILTWAAPAGGSLPIRLYEVREGATWATASLVGVTSDRLYSIPVNWTSSKTFWVAAVDTAGNYGTAGSRVVTFVAYAAPTGLSAAISQASVTLSWQTPINGSLDIEYYDIRHGGSWGTGEIIGKVNTTTITLPLTWLGNRTLWVTAVDTNKQFGTPASVVTNVAAPGAPSVSSAVVVAKAELTWTAPSSTLPIKEYEIRHGASFAAGTVVATTLSTTYRAPVEWLGNRTYWIAARDVNGNVGTAGSTIVSVTAPVSPTVSGTFMLDEFKLNWTDPAATLPIEEYEIRYGANWAAGTVLGRVKGTTISTKAQWLGSRTWWVAAIDVNGNVGSAGSAALNISAPSQPTLTHQVVDNNVLLYWSQPTGTLPVVTTELRRGATWAGAMSIGQKAGGFTTIFETVAGLYTYWVAGVDSAGNVGEPRSITARVDQPPDYVLQLDRNSDFNGRNFEFSALGDPEGWTTSGATAVVSGGSLVLSSTSGDPMLVSSLTGEFFYGCERPVVVMRIRRIAGSTWQGDMYYETAGHSYSESFKETVPVGPAIGQTMNIVWDMNTLTAGGLDWMNSRINTVRFDLGNTAADQFEIEYIRFMEYTGSNVELEEANTLVMPVNTTDTFEQHFEQNILANPNELWDTTKWTVGTGLGSFYAATQSTAVADPYGTSGSVTRFVANPSTAVLFLRKAQTFLPATYSESIYVYVPSQAGVTNWSIQCDFQDTDISSTTPASTAFNQWVKVTVPLVAPAAVRTFLDFNILVNGATPASGFTFYATGARAKIGSAAWASPQDQVNAGFPLFIQPTVTPSLFTQIVDYGTVLAATKVTVTPTYVVLAGSPTIKFTLSVRASTSDAWTVYPDVQSIYVSGFRYLRIEMEVTNTNQLGLIRMSNLNIKFDSKLKSAAGQGVSGASDSVSGTTAVINGTSYPDINPVNTFGNRVPDGAGTMVRPPIDLVDVTAIDVSVAAGSTARYALYDYADVSNPAGFKVLLFDAAGTRVGGSFSWSVRGY